MTLPGITQTITDGGLGLAEGDASQIHIKLGVTSSGTENVLAFYTDPDRLKTDYAQGPAVDAAIYSLQTAGGVVGMMRIHASIAGVAGSVTATRGGAGDSTGTMTVSGAPNDAYDVQVKLTKQGTNIAAGTAAFKYTVDGGDNFSDEIALPTGGVYVIPNTGLTITFVNGSGTSFKVDDVHAFTCTAPGYSSTDVSDSLDALRTTYKKDQFGFVHLVGQASSSAGAATIATTVDTKMIAEFNNFRFLFCIVEWPDESDATIQASVANFTSVWVLPVAGFVEVVVNGKSMKRSLGTVAAGRLAAQDPCRDLGRTRSDKEGGPIPGVTKLYRDEGATPGLDGYGFTTARTYPGQSGFWFTHGKMKCPAGSDFKYIQYRRVMNVACGLAYETLFPRLNDDEFTTNADGTLDELDARNLESVGQSKLEAGLLTSKPRRVSGVSFAVNRRNNIGSTLTLQSKVRIRPKPTAKWIEIDLGFENVSLRPQ